MLRRADDVVTAMGKENRRRSSRNPQARSQLILVLGLEVTWVNQNSEVRPATDVVNIIDGLVRSFLEIGCCGDSQMASSGEAHDADSLRVEAPLFGFASD